MNEENVTKNILRWLLEMNWKIICFDFPQSGTGRFLHPNDSRKKNLGSINPDIVAVKDDRCVFFENKDRYYYDDFIKTNNLRTYNDYSNSIDKLLNGYTIENFYYGIGIPEEKYSINAKNNSYLVDFIVGVQDTGKSILMYSDSNKDNPFG